MRLAALSAIMPTSQMSSPWVRCLTPLVLLLLVVAGCSGRGPTSPSSGGSSADGPGSAAAPGAVIQGVVTSAGGAAVSSAGASVSAVSLSGLKVRVVGTEIAADVSGSGEFLLTGVPGGNVKLQFQGGSVDATADLANVSGQQAIVVQVQVTGTSAVIVSEVREGKVTLCHAESGSRYHAITVAESSEPAHRAHGDGKVGDPVPGKPSRTFAEDCTLLGPEVDIEKATNGRDADSAPGPEIKVGDPVAWTYVVRNAGTVQLSGIQVTDDKGVVVNCSGQTTLAPGASMTCTGSGLATLGQYRNVGTVTANWASATASGTVTDSDASHYTGVSPTTEGEGLKIMLCHKTGAGRWVELEVSLEAESAHRAHGDAKKGEAVPGEAGKVFSTACVPQ